VKSEGVDFFYTYSSDDGNPVLEGSGSLPGTDPVDIQLREIPAWIVAGPYKQGSIWVAVSDTGSVEAYYLTDGEASPIEIDPTQLPAGTPPVLWIEGDTFGLLPSPAKDESPWTHALHLSDGVRLSVLLDGALRATQGQVQDELGLVALPDGRMVQDELGIIRVLTGATDVYDHGVLGDALEASGVSWIEVSPEFNELRRVEPPTDKVIEGVRPLLGDLDGDGRLETLVTLSDYTSGARYVAYSPEGILIGESAPIGQGYRWRHQIAVAPFGPAGQIELVGVRTPHIGGVVEYFRLVDGELVQVAQLTGLTSHQIGSRNLDMAIAGDLDGEGAIELLLPDPSYENLGAVRRTNSGAEVVWSIPLEERLSTNLTGFTLQNGELAIGAGRIDGVLRVWAR
jgi:hypothetical protein